MSLWRYELPGPGEAPLSSNRRVHWGKEHKHKSHWREVAGAYTYATIIPMDRERIETIDLLLEIQPPDKRARDEDNLVAFCLKPVKDGVTDALGLEDDTPEFVSWDVRLLPPGKGWRYWVTVRDTTEEKAA